MGDPVTTTAPIGNLIPEDCWAQRQLRQYIKTLSVASKLKISTTIVRVVFTDTLAISELNGTSLHHYYSESRLVYRRLLGLTPATQGYMVRPGRITAHEMTVFCSECMRYQAGDILLDCRYLHNCWAVFSSVCAWLLGFTPASELYKVCLCHIKTWEVPLFCGVHLYSSPGDTLLDSKYLHNRSTAFDALGGR